MSASGVKNFENDDALDWIWDLENSKDFSLLRGTLQVVVDWGDNYLDVRESSNALAAAEVVAALSQVATPDLPDEVKMWISQHQTAAPNPDLTQLALKAIQRVKTNSELQELWDESDYTEAWYAILADLEKRLIG